MSDYRYFDEKGNEMFPKPIGELTFIGQTGGTPDKLIAILYVESNQLDRNIVSELLEVQPDSAWNPGEKHPYGPPEKGYTRSANWGRWKLQTEKSDSDLDEKIKSLFAKCSSNIEHWQTLSLKYETWLTIVGYFQNWNRELILRKDTLNEIHKRKLNLKFDTYFVGDSNPNSVES